MPSAKLPFEELQTAVRILAGVLIQHQITFGIMGGAGVALIAFKSLAAHQTST
jgi:hypothetical protein